MSAAKDPHRFNVADAAHGSGADQWRAAYEEELRRRLNVERECKGHMGQVQRASRILNQTYKINEKLGAWAKDILTAIVTRDGIPPTTDANPDPWMTLAEHAVEAADSLMVALELHADSDEEQSA